MPIIQLLNHRSHPAPFPSGSKHDPGSGHFFVGSTPAADAGNRNIINELARMFEETILYFDWRYLGTGDFENILKFSNVNKSC